MPPEHSRRGTPDALMQRVFGPPDNPYTVIDVDLEGNPIQSNETGQNSNPELHSEVDQGSVPSPEPSPTTPRSRWQYGRFSGRTALAGVLLAASGAVMLNEEPVSAEDTQTVAESLVPHTVYRTGGDGVWLHDSPGLGTPLKVVMPEGSQFNVDCFVTGGDNVNGNRLWLQGEYNGQKGAVTDYYISTKWNTTQDLVNQRIEECGTVQAQAPEQQPAPVEQAPQQKSCYFNMKWLKTDLTFSYEGEHRYYGNAWQAAKNWTDLDAGISIKPAPEGQEGDIVFKDVWTLRDEDGRSWYGKAYVPDEDSVTISPPEGPDPGKVEIKISRFYAERLDDYARTYTLTHEMGHALGLAHADNMRCGNVDVSKKSLMMSGDRTDIENLEFNKPQLSDKIALEELYK